jgi:hypothetical protein
MEGGRHRAESGGAGKERGGMEGWSRNTCSRKKQRAIGSGRRKKESRSITRRISIKERAGRLGRAASLGARLLLSGRLDCILSTKIFRIFGALNIFL